MREQPSDQIKEHNAHQGQQGAARQYNKKYLKIILNRTLVFVELGMNLVTGHLRCRFWMAVNTGADSFPVVDMGDGIRVFGGQHLVDGLPRFDMAIKAIGDSFIQKIGRFAVKRFAVREYRFGGETMSGDDLLIVMASGTYFGNVARISDFVQAGGDVIVKPVDKII